MRKIATSLLLVVFLATMVSMPVFATEKSTTVRATSDTTVEAWEWSVPTYIDIEGTTANSVGGGNIEVYITRLDQGHSVTVTFNGSENDFKLVKDGDPDTEVAYALWCDSTLVTTAGQPLVSSVTSQTTKGLAAMLGEDILIAGTYSDVLGFSASVSEI